MTPLNCGMNLQYKHITCITGLTCILLYLCYKMTLHSGFILKSVERSSQDEMMQGRYQSVRSNDLERCSGYGRNTSNHSDHSCEKRLPNCILIGVEKAGTYALLKFLSVHPQIVRNTSYNEIYFFDRYYEKGLDWYKNKMPYSLPGQIVFEKTPSYFVRSEVPARVFRMNPNIRLLLTVRNPVQRSLSAYAMEKEKHHGFMEKFEKLVQHPNGYFESASPFIQHSLYDYYLQRWLKYFSLKQIHIIAGDSFSLNPLAELKSIEKFLEIDSFFTKEMFVYNSTKHFYCIKTVESNNDGKTVDCLKDKLSRKHPMVSQPVIQKMKEFFRPHNLRFFNMTGKYFDWNN